MRGSRVKALRRETSDGVLLKIMRENKCSARCAMRRIKRAYTRGKQGQQAGGKKQ